MEKPQILEQFQGFLREYNAEEKDEIWQQQSASFRRFWNEKIISPREPQLDPFEVDSIIRMIDRQARGNTPQNEAIAKMLISQAVWRRMFEQLKTDQKLAELVDQIIGTFEPEKRIVLINDLYKYNEPYKNSLTGKSGNAINAFIFMWAPQRHVSVVSLADRQRLIQFFGFQGGPDFEKDSSGEKIVKSNEALVSGFNEYFGSQYSPRTICTFLYHAAVRDVWRSEDIGDGGARRGWSARTPESEPEVSAPVVEQRTGDPALFYMESQLEDFLIENWDKTELGKKYDLIEEDGEVVSQQYPTEVGQIDILAQDKKTKQYVVIELKKNQTSDDTVGQLARYMGWIEEKKANGKTAKGIIIAAQYDQRLYYALRMMRDTEVYLYRVDFKLEEFKDGTK